MLPILFKAGPVAVYSYGVMLALAFIACWVVGRWYLMRRGIAGEVALDLVLAAAIGGIVGARALFVASAWEYYAAHPLWIFQLQRGGMVFYGGLAGGAAGVIVYTLVRRFPIAVVADAAGLAMPLGIAIGRLGCLLNGCCGGRPTNAWYGVVLESAPGPVFPSQVLDTTLNLAIFLGLVAASRLRLRSGTLWWAFLTVYPLSRFLVETTRINPTGALGLTQAQLISIPLFLVGSTGLLYTLLRRESAAGPIELTPVAGREENTHE